MRFLDIAAALKKEARVKRHVLSSVRPLTLAEVFLKSHHVDIGVSPHYRKGTIHAPEGRNIRDLYVLAHECGHAAFDHGRQTPRWLAEYQAETWAIAALQRHGVVVSKAQMERAKANVRMELSAACDFSSKQTEAAEWCRN